MIDLKKWLHNHTYTGDNSLAEAQLQQTKARILLTIASLTYVILHGEYFDYYMVEALSFAAFYFAANIAALIRLRRHRPFSTFGSLVYPLLDVGIVTFGMLIDGGHSSGIYLMLLPTIIGNGLRFGNPLLIYAQVMCLIGMLISTAYGHYTLDLPVDFTLLSWQIFTLIAVPFYVYLIGLKLEKAIKEKNIAEETSFHLLDNGPLPVFTYEIDDQKTAKILYANAATGHLFQDEHGSLIGKGVDVLTLEEDRQEILDFCRYAYRQNVGDQHHAQSLYIRGKDKSGNVLKLMLSVICMRWRNRQVGVCFILDITQRETLQEQLEAVHRQGYMSTLVAGIVHDFRNVLTNMIGYAEVLHMSSSNDVEKGQINEIIAAGERGSDLITHLLKLSKNSNTENQIHSFTKADLLVQPLENIVGLTRLQLPQNIKLICQISEPLNDVAISIIEVEQILLNLINNSTQAIKDSGTIRVEIAMDSEHKLAQPGHPALSIKVFDDGIGISQEDQHNVFKAFWTSRDTQGGSGLGLTMVQRIVKLHHGDIQIESSPGEETCFIIHLPPYIDSNSKDQKDTDKTEVAIEAPKKKQGAFDITSTYHILLVDDAPDILKIHQAMLSRMGHSSATAESGKQALELFLNKEHDFDLVITDFRMPVMNGLELVQELRKIGSRIPILMVTAFGEDEQLQQVGRHQVLLMNKPVTMDKFRDAIAECMARKPAAM